MALGDREYSVKEIHVLIGNSVRVVVEYRIEAKEPDDADKRVQSVEIPWATAQADLTADELASLTGLIGKISLLPKGAAEFLATATLK